MTSLVIAGAGIGGLTLAAALQRQGLDVHVYERAPRLERRSALRPTTRLGTSFRHGAD